MSEQRIEIGEHVWFFKPFECNIHKPENAQGYIVGADIETLIESIAKLKAERDVYKEHTRYLLSFVPEWAKEAPEGLCPTMYGTPTQEGDTKVVEKIKEVVAALPEYMETSEREEIKYTKPTDIG